MSATHDNTTTSAGDRIRDACGRCSNGGGIKSHSVDTQYDRLCHHCANEVGR